jgi:hypothetical protein
VVADLRVLRDPDVERGPLPRPCHRVSPAEETKLRLRLLATGMARLIHIDEIPLGPTGKPLVGGLFAVPKDADKDRLIYDRRVQNHGEHRLNWLNLPNASLLCQLRLEDGEYLRGSGDDLRNYYYCISHHDAWHPYNAVGRPVVGDDSLLAHGALPGETYYTCLKVAGMGDHNSCDIAQVMHEGVLRANDALPAESLMSYGKPAPRSRIWQGLYLDDLLVVYRARLIAGLPAVPEATDDDALLLRRTEVAYENAGLERAMNKSFRYETSFKAWGAEVDGLDGRICAGADRRLGLMKALSVLLRDGCAHKNLLEKLLGHCGFVFSFKRHMLSIFHRAYRFVNSMPEGKWVRLDVDILDEFRAALLHIPFAFSNLRAPLSSSLWATDATPVSGGATVAPLAGETAAFLYSRAETRGACLRLDGDHPAAMTERMIPIDDEVNKLVAALPCCECRLRTPFVTTTM